MEAVRWPATMDRRAFLSALTAGAIAAAMPASRIVDTHTHFYDPSRPQGVPWPQKDEQLLYRTVLPGEYKRIAMPLGVTGAIVIEASPWVEDNQWILDLAHDDPFLLGVVGHLDPGAADFKAHFDRFRRNPLFRGIRIGDTSVSATLADRSAAVDIERLADADLEVDFLGAIDTPLIRFADRFSNLRIVIDHLPGSGRNNSLEELAAHPNVSAKVSGVLQRSSGGVPTDLAHYVPALDQLWTLFGSGRLLYGSNWPVSELVAPYAAVLKIVAEYFTKKGPDAAERFFWKNAHAVYRWPGR